MPYRIRPEDRIHIGEFRDRPLSPHGPELQRILNAMRDTPLEGRYILVCTKPFREWKLARHGGRKRPIEILTSTCSRAARRRSGPCSGCGGRRSPART